MDDEPRLRAKAFILFFRDLMSRCVSARDSDWYKLWSVSPRYVLVPFVGESLQAINEYRLCWQG